MRDASTRKDLVIVDPVQSLANPIEATLIKQPGAVLDGSDDLPFVRLTITDPAGCNRSTSSLELPHRLASGSFCQAKDLKPFQDALVSDILDHGLALTTFHRWPNSCKAKAAPDLRASAAEEASI
jgi:hypothetical protein